MLRQTTVQLCMSVPPLTRPRVRMWVFLWPYGMELLLFWLLVLAGVVFQKVRPTRPEIWLWFVGRGEDTEKVK